MPRSPRPPLAALAALLALVLATAAGAGARRGGDVPQLVFPVAAPTSYQDDFGDARSDGPPHPGNDLLAARRAPAVAAEAGTVSFWTSSTTAGCMLYLHGDSGTVYEYIHLNNDRTLRNDNRGRCVPGTAYAPGLKDGARVEAGQLVGYVGDSGDANGLHPHLHFEVHPGGGAAVDPYPYLQQARHLLFWARPGAPYVLVLQGTVAAADAGSLTLDLSTVRAYPGNTLLRKLVQTVSVAVPATARVLQAGGAPAALGDVAPGTKVAVWTEPALATLAAQLGADGSLVAALVQLPRR